MRQQSHHPFHAPDRNYSQQTLVPLLYAGLLQDGPTLRRIRILASASQPGLLPLSEHYVLFRTQRQGHPQFLTKATTLPTTLDVDGCPFPSRSYSTSTIRNPQLLAPSPPLSPPLFHSDNIFPPQHDGPSVWVTVSRQLEASLQHRLTRYEPSPL